MIPERVGRYEIRSEIGRGGMATVYLAHDPRFRRDVAIKVLSLQFLDNETFRARFEREAQIIASLEHPAVVPVYDFGDEDGQPFLVMRYMPGGSLSDRLCKGPMTFAQASQIISRLAPALDAIHQHGIVHRDLKPGNILFDQYANGFISDFGIARLAQATTTLTGDAIIGTPSYMSPEQVRGEADIDGRSDIYALGAILFEMLTGKQPYEATTPMGVALKQITEPVPRIRQVKSDLPPEVEGVIERAMAKDRAGRYQTANELAAAQEAIATAVARRMQTTNGDTGVKPPPAALPETETAIHSSPPDPPGSLAWPSGDGPEGQPEPEPAPIPVEGAGLQAFPGAGAALPPAAQAYPAAPTHPPAGAFPPPGIPAGPPRRVPGWIWGAGALAVIGLCLVIFLGGGTAMMAFLRSQTPQPAGTEAVSIPTLEATELPTDTAFHPLVDGETPQAGETAVPTAALNFVGDLENTRGPTPTPGLAFFQDSFDNPGSGWEVGKEAGVTLAYEYGNFRILVEPPETIAWSTPLLNFTDVSLGVNATKVAGAEDNLFGIICRYQDENNFYFFGISSSGYYGIFKVKDQNITFLKMDTYEYSPQIHQGLTTNRLRADCVGSTLAFYANDTRLIQVEDNEYRQGDVGLIAAAFDSGDTNILFDDFQASKPR